MIMPSTGERARRRLLARVAQAGGSIAVPKTDIGSGFGFFAHFIDTEGNKVGLHSMV